jgi:hypothetical protein
LRGKYLLRSWLVGDLPGLHVKERTTAELLFKLLNRQVL